MDELEEIKRKLLMGSYRVLAFDADNTLYKVANPKAIYDKALGGLNWCFDFEISDLYDALIRGFRMDSLEAWWYSKHMWFVVLNMLQHSGCKREKIEPRNILQIFRESKKMYDRFIEYLMQEIKLTDIGEKAVTLSKRFIIVVLSEEEKTILEKKLEATGLLDIVKLSISSTDTGYLKPHRRYFDIFFKRFPEIRKDYVLYVDDLKENVKFAKEKIGVDAITVEQFREIIDSIH